jgi:hypothetical protein
MLAIGGLVMESLMMHPSETKPVLSDVLSILLPKEQQTAFLRACLWTGEKGCQAWKIWRESFSNPRDFLKQKKFGVKGLTPLLYHNLQRNGVAIENSLLTFFRTAQIYEEKRTTVFREICHNVLTELTRTKKRFLVVKGAALADTAFDTPALRHCHDLDIVLDDPDLHHTLQLLTSLDFSVSSRTMSDDWRNIILIHRHGLPVSLHRAFFGISIYNRAQNHMWRRSQRQLIADVPCQVLAPEDALLHVCGQAFTSGRSTLPPWVADSCSILTRFPNLDWNHLIECAKHCHLELPMSVMLGYLADQLQAPVPRPVLNHLWVAASRNTIGREITLSVARNSESGGFRGLLGNANNWRNRIPILKWMLFPSSSYIRWTKPHMMSWILPFHYVSRPVKYLARRFRRFFEE